MFCLKCLILYDDSNSCKENDVYILPLLVEHFIKNVSAESKLSWKKI